MNYLIKICLSVLLLSTILLGAVFAADPLTNIKICDKYAINNCTELSVSADNPNMIVQHGEQVNVSFTVSNTGDQNGFSHLLFAINNQYFSTTKLSEKLLVPSGKSIKMTFPIVINNTTLSNNFLINFTVIGSLVNSKGIAQSKIEHVTVNFSILNDAAVLSVTPKDVNISAQHGEQVNVSFYAQNTGNTSGKVTLNLQSNNSYFTASDYNQTYTIDNGDPTTEIVFPITIEDTTLTNSFSMTFNITESYISDGQTITDNDTKIVVNFTITDKAPILTASANQNYDTIHGQTTNIVFQTNNTGNLAGDVKITLPTNSNNFTADDYEKIVTLNANSSENVTFAVTVSDNASNSFTIPATIVKSYVNLDVENVSPPETINLNFTIKNSPNLFVTVDQTNYYGQPDEILEVLFTAENTGNLDGQVTIQLELDEDDEDYFTPESTSEKQEVSTNNTEEIKFEIDIDADTPLDNYTIPFKIIIFYKDNQGINQQTESTINITLHVDDYDPIDVELEEDIICVGQEAPFETNLIFTNNENDTYYIEPKVKSTDLKPTVKSGKIKIQEDEEEKVEVKFNKIPKIGEYEITVEQNLYESKTDNNPKSFKNNLTIKVVANCKSEFVNLYINNNSVSVKQGEKGTVSFIMTNTTDESMSASISAESSDPTLNIVVDNADTVLTTDYANPGNVYVYPTDNTTPGVKTVTVKAVTPYSTETDTVSIVVVKSGLNITTNSIEVPLGLKGSQTVTLQNNTGATLSLTIYALSNDSDVVTPSTSTLTLAAGETKNIYVGIVPKTIGNKKYTLQISGGINVSKEIVYSSSSTQNAGALVTSYTQNAEPIAGKTVLLPIIFNNPYDFTLTATIKFKTMEGVTSKKAYIVLNPKTQTSASLEYTAYTVGTLKPTLEVSSELGTEEYLVTLKVKADASNAKVLEIAGMPTEVPFVNNKEVTITFKVSNPNAFEVKNNTLRMVLEDGTVVGEKLFNINQGQKKDVTVKFTVESNEEITGTISLLSGDAENKYDVTFIKDSSFANAGLFSLGFGSTLGIILGIVIVVLLILYFSLRSNPTA